MGQGESKLISKLAINARHISIPILLAITNEDLQFLILEYLGQGTVAWIILFASYNIYSNSTKVDRNRCNKVDKNNKRLSDLIKPIHKYLRENPNLYKNYILSIESKYVTSDRNKFTTSQKNMYKNKYPQTYTLELIIGFCGDISTFNWLYGINNNIGNTSHDNYITFMMLLSRSNNLDFCKHIYSSKIKILESKPGNAYVYNKLKNRLVLNFAINNNLNGVKWCKFIGALDYDTTYSMFTKKSMKGIKNERIRQEIKISPIFRFLKVIHHNPCGNFEFLSRFPDWLY